MQVLTKDASQFSAKPVLQTILEITVPLQFYTACG